MVLVVQIPHSSNILFSYSVTHDKENVSCIKMHMLEHAGSAVYIPLLLSCYSSEQLVAVTRQKRQ